MFRTKLELFAAKQPDLWVVASPLVWTDPVRGNLTVPADFVTDLASIPRVFRNLPWLDPNGISRRPAVLHDWLYGSKTGRRWGKDFADALLRDAIRAEGGTAAQAGTYFYAVHWFGRGSWDGDGVRLAAPGKLP